jgi:hypothetical protein
MRITGSRGNRRTAGKWGGKVAKGNLAVRKRERGRENAKEQVVCFCAARRA